MIALVACSRAVAQAPVSAPSATDVLCQPADAPKQLGGQIFFRGGGGFLTADRGGEVYVDAGGAQGLRNDRTAGYSFGFGFHLPLHKDPLFGNTVLGEVLMDFTRVAGRKVVNTTSALLNQPRVEDVPITQLVVAGSPKYQVDGLGRLRPWLIPAGMAMIVNSPPTDKSAYLDIGIQFGAGLDYRLSDALSLGVDVRYVYNLTRPKGSWLVTGAYVGFNF